MKQIYNLLLILCALFFMVSCQGEQDVLDAGGTGYLRLTVSGSAPTTKAANLPTGYTGKQIAVEIVNAEGKTVKSTNDWTEWEGEQIALAAGKYTLKAHSYGFDGKQSAMAAPYYYGSDEITIEKGKEANRTIVCKLANVKMSVKIADDIKANFKSFGVSVKAKDGTSCDPIAFNIDLAATAIKDTAYFPVTDLVVSYSGQGKEGGSGADEYELTKVAANDHYILNFTLKSEGQGDVTVEVDPTMHTYEYTFKVSQHPFNGASLTANPWAKFAYLSASNVTASSGAALSNMKLQYRQVGTEDWTALETTSAGEGKDAIYSATATSLEPNTTYEYRLVGDNDFATTSMQFTTEDATALYNGGFENWYQAGDVWYAVAQADYNGGNAFWDSGNKGASMGNKNPTQPEEDVVHPGKNSAKSAKLQSQFVGLTGLLGQFAAGNLYTGHFVKTIGMSGAEIQFGSPFTTRPTQLHGYFQYTAGTVDYYGSNTPDDALVKKDGTDMNSIYIALSDADTPYTVNTKEGTFVDFANDPNIIAYGELPVSECKTTNGWKEFTIDLAYRDLTRKPKYIILVCSASKYGDYFTGSSGSVMYIDDFELVYGDTPVVEEKTK